MHDGRRYNVHDKRAKQTNLTVIDTVPSSAVWPTPQSVSRSVKASDGEFCLHYCGREEQGGSTDTVVLPFNAEDVYTA
ncbi:hypothetical protein E2C01_037194 [Portunus trituberculatus]|uniref:Uncharacterized protein n=1 Tax=Portunus trituberculatus TaxID=210409 RepID=A0A5B7FDI0_PORTR|nr:hypothetical protein [Portunus trituberculatus]